MVLPLMKIKCLMNAANPTDNQAMQGQVHQAHHKMVFLKNWVILAQVYRQDILRHNKRQVFRPCTVTVVTQLAITVHSGEKLFTVE